MKFFYKTYDDKNYSSENLILNKITPPSFSNHDLNYKDPLDDAEEYFIEMFNFSKPIVKEFKDFQKKYQGRYYITKDENFKWKIEGDYLINNLKNMMIYYKNPLCPKSIEEVEFIKKAFYDLYNKINPILLSNGFLLDDLNTFVVEDYNEFRNEFIRRYLYGFKKDNYVCILKGILYCEYNIDSSIKFACTDNYLDHYNKQINILRDLNLKYYSLSSIFKKNNHALIGGLASFYPENLVEKGLSFLIYKVDGRWKEITVLINPPSCKLLKQYNTPDDFMHICYEN